jgi:hypothetical protein
VFVIKSKLTVGKVNAWPDAKQIPLFYFFISLSIIVHTPCSSTETPQYDKLEEDSAALTRRRNNIQRDEQEEVGSEEDEEEKEEEDDMV